jgi:DNA-binding transcriptional regulator YiaG
MPNIASVFKDEIARVARKQVRAETETLKKAVSALRSEIAALKKRAQAAEQQLKKLGKVTSTVAPPASPDLTGKATRFSAKGLASQRKRLGLSAEEVGLLVGSSGQSVYNWEAGSARPREKHLAAIAALRGLGKKSAAAQLATLRTSA